MERIYMERIGNDKAIEFNSVLLETRNMLANLKVSQVDTEDFEASVLAIEDECNREVSQVFAVKESSSVQFLQKSNAEAVYIKYISRLKKLQLEIQKYDVYFAARNVAESILILLESKDLTSDAIKKMVSEIDHWLDAIIDSDTRVYKNEAQVVEKIFSAAYLVMRLELKTFGESSILKKATTNGIVFNYLNNQARTEITSIQNPNMPLTRAIYEAQSEGLKANYLNIRLLAVLDSFQSQESIADIEKRLLDISNELTQLTKELKDIDKTLEEQKKALEVENKKRKSKLKRIAVTIIYLGLVTTIFTTVLKSKKPYNFESVWTTEEVYSTNPNVPSSYLEYFAEGKKDSVNMDLYLPYYPHYTYSNGEIIDYQSSIIHYNIKGIEFEDIQDYANLTNDQLKQYQKLTGDSIIKKPDELTPEDFYEESLVVIKRIQKDPTRFEVNTIGRISTAIILTLIGGLAIIVGNAFIYDKNIKHSIFRMFDEMTTDFKNRMADKEAYAKALQDLEGTLRQQKAILAADEDARKRFMEIYNSFKDEITNQQVIEEYSKLTREK